MKGFVRPYDLDIHFRLPAFRLLLTGLLPRGLRRGGLSSAFPGEAGAILRLGIGTRRGCMPSQALRLLPVHRGLQDRPNRTGTGQLFILSTTKKARRVVQNS
ncbi:uncharacterized protein [Notamacropus eugenii]|uniref:uncharacterized protein n=1 Tax=Notamacropus eugenii TaxID=9315 RepID=UPI003B6744EC